MKKKNKEEISRLQDVLSYGVLGTSYEADFDELAKLASIVCETPIAIISLIDDKRQWYKSKVGIEHREVPIEETICKYTIKGNKILEIENTLESELSKKYPHVIKKDGVRYYAGVPLKSARGHNIGTVCVVDLKPKKLSEIQLQSLQKIADLALNLLEIRKRNTELGEELSQVIEKRINEKEKLISFKENAYNTLFKAISKSSAVVEFSPQGEIIHTNENFLSITGFEEQELIGKHHCFLLDEEDLKNNKKFWDELRKGKFRSGRIKHISKKRKAIWLQASYNPVMNADKSIEKIINVAQDVTAETKARKTLEKTKILADRLNKQKDHFIANMNHELRTPLNAITGFTDLLLDMENDATKKNYVEAIQSAGQKLLFIVNDILDLSKLESGLFIINKSPFQVESFVSKLMLILKLEAEKKGLDFTYTIDKQLPEIIIADKNRISQVLINLLNNAIKFTEKGYVKLNIKQEGENIVFSVKDSGKGVAKDKLYQIFERFAQEDEKTSQAFGGTGLGLNISKRLVEIHGGKIAVKSSEEKGSDFYFSIPLKEGVLSISNTNTTISDREKTEFKGIKVLVCEDNILNQKLMSAILTELKIECDIAENGVKGIKLLQKNSYDLILMDIQMPEKDGCETAIEIRNELKIDTPIIALTSYSRIKDKKVEKERYFSLGMNDYMSKPFKKEELIYKIRKHVKQSKVDEKDIETDPVARSNFDLGHLKEMAGEDEDLMQHLFELFKKEASEDFIDLKKDIEDDDKNGVAEKLHKLKSSFGLFGLRRDLLEEIDKQCFENKNINDIEKKIILLEDYTNKTLKEIEKVL